MARIRTIKPELPHSETLGAVSRDARLLFVNLFTIADDSGRARATSRLLASLLYPYDDDAPRLMDRWLAELSRVGAIRLYSVNDVTYLDIPKWLEHQKIDRPSESRLPAYSESNREVSRGLDALPRTMDLVPTHTQRARGSRLANDWKPSEANYTNAEKLNLTRDETDAIAEQFKRYFLGPDATKPVKKDWYGAFDNWVARDAAKVIGNRNRASKSSGNRQVAGSVVDIVTRLKAEANLAGQNGPGGMGRGTNGLHTATDDGNAENAGESDGGEILDAADAERMFGDARRAETFDGSEAGTSARFGGSIAAICEETPGIPGGRGEESSDEPQRQMVAGVERSEGTVGFSYQETEEITGGFDERPDLPECLRRQPSVT